MFMFTLETKEKNKGQGSAVPGKPPKQWQKDGLRFKNLVM